MLLNWLDKAWFDTKGLDHVNDWMIKMTSWISIEGHESVKARFDRFDRLTRHWGTQQCLGLDKWWLIRVYLECFWVDSEWFWVDLE